MIAIEKLFATWFAILQFARFFLISED